MVGSLYNNLVEPGSCTRWTCWEVHLYELVAGELSVPLVLRKFTSKKPGLSIPEWTLSSGEEPVDLVTSQGIQNCGPLNCSLHSSEGLMKPFGGYILGAVLPGWKAWWQARVPSCSSCLSSFSRQFSIVFAELPYPAKPLFSTLDNKWKPLWTSECSPVCVWAPWQE